MIDDGDCGGIGGMKIGRGNRSNQRKPAPAPLCPPQIAHDLTCAAAVGSQRQTVSSGTALLKIKLKYSDKNKISSKT
jgi:hypothetical protein